MPNNGQGWWWNLGIAEVGGSTGQWARIFPLVANPSSHRRAVADSRKSEWF
jgi:hypothetical protein